MGTLRPQMAILYHYAGGPDIRDMAHIQGENKLILA